MEQNPMLLCFQHLVTLITLLLHLLLDQTTCQKGHMPQGLQAEEYPEKIMGHLTDQATCQKGHMQQGLPAEEYLEEIMGQKPVEMSEGHRLFTQ
jgi:hypothetical protein